MAVNLKIVSQVVASGTPGPAGKSAYQIAVDNGFEGTESEWLKELHPFKGWFDSVSELEEEHSALSVGEYAYVKGATSSDPVKIYECSTEGSWSDSGRTVDTSTVQTFRSGEAVNDVGIDAEPTAGSDNLVKSGGVAGQISQLGQKVNKLTATATGMSTSINAKIKVTLQAGEIIHLKYTPDANTFAVVLRIHNTDNTYQVISGSLSGSYEGDVTCDQNADYVEATRYDASVSGHTITLELTSSLRMEYDATKTQVDAMIPIVDTLVYDVEGFNSEIAGKILLVTTPVQGFVKNDGTFVESSSYRRSDFIPVYEGQEIELSINASSNVFAVSAFSGYNAASFIADSAINLRGDDSQTTYKFTVPSGVKAIVVSRDATDTTANTIVYGSLLEIVNDLSLKVTGKTTVVAFPYNKYINTNGEESVAYSLRCSDFIPVYEGLEINFTTICSSSVLGLSGYSSNTQASFVDSSFNVAGTDGSTPFVIKKIVPSGINFIRICKENAYTDPITVVYKSVSESIAELGVGVATLQKYVKKQPPFQSFKSTSPRKACIVFQMDWGYRAGITCEAYRDKLKQYGVELSTYAVLPSAFDNDINLMKELAAEGNEIALHTDAEHASINTESEITVAQFRELMGKYHEEMAEQGFDYSGCVVLRTSLRSDLFPLITDYHNWTIAGGVDIDVLSSDYLNTVMNLSSNYKFPMRLGVELTPEQAAVSENVTTAINRTIECIDSVIENNGFLIIYCHSYNATTAVYTLLESVLVPVLQHLQPLLEKGQCLTGRTSDLLEYYYSKRFGES